MQHLIKKNYSTKQRNIILEILKKNIDKKITADEIIHTINKNENIISKATVYRNLDYLASKGVIKKINADNISSCYIYNSDENDNSINFYCDILGVLHYFRNAKN
jgi:Fe2+ or Zn2+ uptake regulation protein